MVRGVRLLGAPRLLEARDVSRGRGRRAGLGPRGPLGPQRVDPRTPQDFLRAVGVLDPLAVEFHPFRGLEGLGGLLHSRGGRLDLRAGLGPRLELFTRGFLGGAERLFDLEEALRRPLETTGGALEVPLVELDRGHMTSFLAILGRAS